TSASVPFIWTDIHQKAFTDMKTIMGRQILLTFPNFSIPFHIYTDASDAQLGSVIMQDEKPIAFYSRKLTPTQRRYTVMERELLSIIETLKEYRGILLGFPLYIYTDHKNLTFKNFTSDRVNRWRLLMEEYNYNFSYLPGKKNTIADALSRFPTITVSDAAIQECYETVDDPPVVFPLSWRNIEHAQKSDTTILHMLRTNADVSTQTFGQYTIAHRKSKIIIPTKLLTPIIEWYHNNLCHPGMTRTLSTLTQHFWAPDLRTTIDNYVRTCPACQTNKRNVKHYGHLPAKTAEDIPWHIICADLIGPWTITDGTNTTYVLSALTIIDPATSWIEIIEIPDKTARTTALMLDRHWFCRYPRPLFCIYDNGNEFLGFEFQEMLESYGVLSKPTTIRNPQANAIVE
ncbi:MAG: RNase H-like domain-containing protein, partial [Gaiellaceae bacterium]